MNILSLENINKAITGNLSNFIRSSEDDYHAQLVESAKYIKNLIEDKPIVLISGPSGSGKTTSAMRLGILLEEFGYQTQIISMDNYYIPIDKGPLPVDEDGNIDLESPYRLDMELLQNHLLKINKGEPVDIPVFDFPTQKRVDSIPFKRVKGQFIIIEGIHALNPLVTGNNEDFTTCIYVSVRTRIQNADLECLHPSNIRLARRLIRDKLFRGRELFEVFDMFQSVERGEEKYIMPFKYRSEFDINTFIAYEMPVYRDILLPDLIKMTTEQTQQEHYQDIVKFLSDLQGIPKDYVPRDSLIREFVGGSSFTV